MHEMVDWKENSEEMNQDFDYIEPNEFIQQPSEKIEPKMETSPKLPIKVLPDFNDPDESKEEEAGVAPKESLEEKAEPKVGDEEAKADENSPKITPKSLKIEDDHKSQKEVQPEVLEEPQLSEKGESLNDHQKDPHDHQKDAHKSPDSSIAEEEKASSPPNITKEKVEPKKVSSEGSQHEDGDVLEGETGNLPKDTLRVGEVDRADEQPDRATQKPEKVIERSEEVIEEPDEAIEMADEAIKQPSKEIEQPDKEVSDSEAKVEDVFEIGEVQSEDGKVKDIKAEDTKSKDFKVDQIDSHDVKPEDEYKEDNNAKDEIIEDEKAENDNIEEAKLEDIKSQKDSNEPQVKIPESPNQIPTKPAIDEEDKHESHIKSESYENISNSREEIPGEFEGLDSSHTEIKNTGQIEMTPKSEQEVQPERETSIKIEQKEDKKEDLASKKSNGEEPQEDKEALKEPLVPEVPQDNEPVLAHEEADHQHPAQNVKVPSKSDLHDESKEESNEDLNDKLDQYLNPEVDQEITDKIDEYLGSEVDEDAKVQDIPRSENIENNENISDRDSFPKAQTQKEIKDLNKHITRRTEEHQIPSTEPIISPKTMEIETQKNENEFSSPSDPNETELKKSQTHNLEETKKENDEMVSPDYLQNRPEYLKNPSEGDIRNYFDKDRPFDSPSTRPVGIISHYEESEESKIPQNPSSSKESKKKEAVPEEVKEGQDQPGVQKHRESIATPLEIPEIQEEDPQVATEEIEVVNSKDEEDSEPDKYSQDVIVDQKDQNLQFQDLDEDLDQYLQEDQKESIDESQSRNTEEEAKYEQIQQELARQREKLKGTQERPLLQPEDPEVDQEGSSKRSEQEIVLERLNPKEDSKKSEMEDDSKRSNQDHDSKKSDQENIWKQPQGNAAPKPEDKEIAQKRKELSKLKKQFNKMLKSKQKESSQSEQEHTDSHQEEDNKEEIDEFAQFSKDFKKTQNKEIQESQGDNWMEDQDFQMNDPHSEPHQEEEDLDELFRKRISPEEIKKMHQERISEQHRQSSGEFDDFDNFDDFEEPKTEEIKMHGREPPSDLYEPEEPGIFDEDKDGDFQYEALPDGEGDDEEKESFGISPIRPKENVREEQKKEGQDTEGDVQPPTNFVRDVTFKIKKAKEDNEPNDFEYEIPGHGNRPENVFLDSGSDSEEEYDNIRDKMMKRIHDEGNTGRFGPNQEGPNDFPGSSQFTKPTDNSKEERSAKRPNKSKSKKLKQYLSKEEKLMQTENQADDNNHDYTRNHVTNEIGKQYQMSKEKNNKVIQKPAFEEDLKEEDKNETPSEEKLKHESSSHAFSDSKGLIPGKGNYTMNDDR